MVFKLKQKVLYSRYDYSVSVYQQPLVEKLQSNPRVYKVRFTPVGEAGEQIPITVNYDGKPLSASPFVIRLQPKPHPDNVQIVQSPTPSGQEQGIWRILCIFGWFDIMAKCTSHVISS